MRMDQLPTPCYVIDEKKLKENLEILGDVREKAGCKILLAQKAFSCSKQYRCGPAGRRCRKRRTGAALPGRKHGVEQTDLI